MSNAKFHKKKVKMATKESPDTNVTAIYNVPIAQYSIKIQTGPVRKEFFKQRS